MAGKLKIGVIGTGFIANMAHLPNYAEFPDQCELVAFCDINDKALKESAEKFGVTKLTDNFEDIANDPEIDAVSVATPNKFHAEHAIACLQAGKHVLCEKPLAMNGAEARRMVQASKESGKILQVGLQSRFGQSGQFMRDFIANGHMGDIQYARAQALRRRGVPHWGVFIDKEKQGGGPLIDIGVHILDLTLYFMGYPKPVCATGKTWDTLGKDPKITNWFGPYDTSKFTVEDLAVGMIRFDNGAVVTLESSFMANIEGDPYQTQLFGTKAGAIVKASGGEGAVKIYKEIDGQYFEMSPPRLPDIASSYREEISAFLSAIQNGDGSPVPGECGLTLNAVFDALYKSSVTGHEEPVDVSF